MILANLTSGHEERIASEKAIAEERAQQRKEREAPFSQQVKQLESKAKNTEVRLKTELNHARPEWAKLEKQMRDEHEQVGATFFILVSSSSLSSAPHSSSSSSFFLLSSSSSSSSPISPPCWNRPHCYRRR
jgi:hypothetical protein